MNVPHFLGKLFVDLNAKKPILKEERQLLLTPQGLTTAMNGNINLSGHQVVDSFWKEAIPQLMDVCVAQEPQDQIDKLQVYIKTLSREAAHQQLWFSQIVKLNCEELCMRISGLRDNKILEDAASTIRHFFRVTLSDSEREEAKKGRTMECYPVACLLLRIYVKMNAFSLAEGIIQAIHQYSQYIPPLSEVNWHSRVQYLYYCGVFAFHEQKYKESTDFFQGAIDSATFGSDLRMTSSQFNKLMSFNIPARFIAYNQWPTAEVYALIPQLSNIYRPLIEYCRQGNYKLYIKALKKRSRELKLRRLYLSFEVILTKLRLHVLRRLWMVDDKPKRLPINMYTNALKLSGFVGIDDQDAEFYLAQLIHQGEVKGYIHHEFQLLLLSKTQPFPQLIKNIVST